MTTAHLVSLLIQASYFVAAVLLIMGIKRMSSPVTARSGIQWAGLGVLVAVVVTFLYRAPHTGGAEGGLLIQNALLIFIAIALSTAVAWYSGKRVAMTAMPQMVALYNGMGGGSAAAIGASALLAFAAATAGSKFVAAAPSVNQGQAILAVAGGQTGAIPFTRSLIPFA